MTLADPRQRLTVHAGRARVAMAADSVAEVIRAPRLTRMPHAPPGLLGVTYLRGVVLPVLSLSALLGADDAGQATRVVVLRRDPPIGLAVDAIEALQTIEAADPAPQHGRLMLNDEHGAQWFDLDAALQDRFAAFGASRQSSTREAAASPGVTPLDTLAFLGFSLAGQSYALPLDAVAEVMTPPEAILVLPRTEEVLIGVFAVRGEVLPIISLRALLGLEARAVAKGDRIIVTQIAEQRLALLVDDIRVILRASPDAVGPAPSLFNIGAGEAQIDSVLRLPDGQGLVSILAPNQILADERVSRLIAETTGQKEETMPPISSSSGRERFLVIQLGGETYGLPIAAVDEVVRRPQTLTRLPKAPAYVEGVMSLRGKVIPIIDQGRRFSVAGASAEATRRVVVVTVDALQAGFAVDAVSEILEIEQQDLMPAPELSKDEGRLFDRAARVGREGDVILLIDPRALLNRAEADLLRDLTAKSHAS